MRELTIDEMQMVAGGLCENMTLPQCLDGAEGANVIWDFIWSFLSGVYFLEQMIWQGLQSIYSEASQWVQSAWSSFSNWFQGLW